MLDFTKSIQPARKRFKDAFTKVNGSKTRSTDSTILRESIIIGDIGENSASDVPTSRLPKRSPVGIAGTSPLVLGRELPRPRCILFQDDDKIGNESEKQQLQTSMGSEYLTKTENVLDLLDLKSRNLHLPSLGLETGTESEERPPLTAQCAELVLYKDNNGEMCSAMALTEDMVSDINKILQYEQRIDNLKWKIQSNAGDEEYMLADMEQLGQRLQDLEPTSNTEASDVSEEQNSVRKNIADLRKHRTQMERTLARLGEEVSFPIASVFATWRNVLTKSSLLEPLGYDAADDQQLRSSVVGRNSSQPSADIPSPREEARIADEEFRCAAIDYLKENELQLQDARWRIDNWNTHYGDELMAFKKEVAHGEQEDARTWFDRCLLQEHHEALAELNWAEDEVRKAKEHVRSLGLDLSDAVQQSGFADCPDDGYCESLEAAMVAHVDRGVVEKWMDGEDDRSMHSQELDGWDAESVGISDSVSIVATGKDRMKIDRWRMVCEAQATEAQSFSAAAFHALEQALRRS